MKQLSRHQRYRRTPAGQYAELKRASKRKGVKMTLTFKEFLTFRSYPCVYCSGKLSEAGYSLDRLKAGGDYSKENCVAACFDCNRARGDTKDRLEVMIFGAVKDVLKKYLGDKRGKRRAG